MNRKGMTKTVGLIIAASVLLMTAAIVVFMTKGGLEDVFSGSNRQSCITQVQSKCDFGADSFPAPKSCDKASIDNWGAIDGVESGGETIQCS